jgi:hypothetical protein
MKTLPILAICTVLLFGPRLAQSQPVNTSQQVTLAGLRSANGHGSFPAASYGPDGSLYLLYDQRDGIRVLKLNAAGTTVLAQAQLGTTGDSPLAIALDPAGNVYVAGTSTSTNLSGTSAAAFPSRADASTNSFLAKFDANLNTVFVTFLGAGRTSVASVAATADAVFVTGITFNAAFPVSNSGIQQTPANGTSENGFVERFTTNGAMLTYATYLTGANGSTAPSAIVADAQDNAYVAGYTSATGYPTIAALTPEILGANSGFLTKLTPAGDGFLFSTFIPGAGITGLALAAANQSLLLTGSISLGQFPIATVSAPLAATGYQSLLRIPLSGQAVTASILLIPATQSFVTAGPNGTAWITGQLNTPLFPGTSEPLALLGDSFALHITTANTIDQTLRFGGQPADLFGNATLTTLASAPALSPDGTSVAFPASLTATFSPSTTPQRFDLPTVQTPNAALPNTLRDLTAACTGTSQCLLTAGYLTLLSTINAPSLSISADDVPNLVVRNLGSATATGLVLMASGQTIASNCGPTLAPSNSCNVALTVSGTGTFTVSAANATTETVPLPANTLAPNALGVSPVELDFGIQTSASPAATRTLTVTNLSQTTQTFTSALDSTALTLLYALSDAGSDCTASGSSTKILAAGATCHITLALAALSASSSDGAVRAAWKVGTSDITITGITQAAALNVSASEVDFGTQFSGGLRLPRYLYLSNNAATAITHTFVLLPAYSPFSVLDECPSTLEPHSVCRLTLNYLSTNVPSTDSTVLTLDAGISVLVTGTTLPQQGTNGSSANPSLSVTPSSLTFATPVVVTGVSGSTQNVVVQNTGATSLTLTVSVSGDFTIQNGCPATLLGGSSCQVFVSFAPSQPGARQGLLAIGGGNGFSPAYVALSGTATPILPANNGTLDLGQTLVGEPTVAWFKVQQSLASLTIAVNSSVFGVAIVEDLGFGHGTLPPASFAPTATSTCNNCWIGIQFLSQSVGTQGATLALSTVANGNTYTLALTGTALPVSGLLLTPITQDFGPVPVNSSTSPRLFTLANLLTPGAPISITSVTATGDFTTLSNQSGGQTCTATLAPTASCFVQVIFSPTAVGPRGGTLTIATSVGNVTAALGGNGLNDPGFAINPTELDFNNVPGTAATQQSIVLSNTGTATLSIGAIVSSDPSFIPSNNCSALAPGATCTVTVTFRPGFAPTSATLSIAVTSTVNGQTTTATYTATLSGPYTTEDGGLQILPDVVNFGTTSVGALGVTRLFTINNLTAKSVAISLTLPRQFPLATPSACTSLAPFGSCSFSVIYLPATAGAATGTVFAQGIPADGSVTLQALGYMQGFGSAAGVLAITGNIIPNSALNFGQPTSGQSAQQTLTLTNTGAGTLTVRRITTEPPFFSTTSCGATLAANQICTVTLTYSPVDQVASGGLPPLPRADAGTLTIESDAASSPDMVQLTGSVAPTASSSSNNGALLSAFSLSQGSLTFANTAVGNASTAQIVTLTNDGSTTLHVLNSMASTDFVQTNNCATLLPGVSCSYTISFHPTNFSTAAIRMGTLEITSDASTALEFISLFGTTNAAPLAFNPTALDFGTLNVGSSSTLGVTLTNNSGVPVTFNGLTANGDYSVLAGTCSAIGSSLAAGASCILQVTFTPVAIGTRTGALSVSSDATTLPLTVPLTGVAVAARLQIVPGALIFGTVAVGSPTSLSLTLLNAGSASVTGISGQISGANLADFVITTQCSTPTLTPNQGCTMTVLFTPSALGLRTATLTVVSSDPSSPATIPLTGSGGEAAAASFTLTVGGASSASVTVQSGSPATYALVVTPINGFTGPVALTCAPVTPGMYAACSLVPSTVNLNGSPQTSTVTINTITKASLELHEHATVFLALLGLPLLLVRRARRIERVLLLLMFGVFASGSLIGCGGSGNGGVLYTPAGGYQYTVTATSTSGTQITQTVTLNLNVQ